MEEKQQINLNFIKVLQDHPPHGPKWARKNSLPLPTKFSLKLEVC